MVFNVDERIYDTLNYNEGIITNIENDIITYRDNNFNNRNEVQFCKHFDQRQISPCYKQR